MSFAEQSKVIIDTVYNSCRPLERYPFRVYDYLSDVTIVVEDEAGFSNVEMSLLQERSFLKSMFGGNSIISF